MLDGLNIDPVAIRFTIANVKRSAPVRSRAQEQLDYQMRTRSSGGM